MRYDDRSWFETVSGGTLRFLDRSGRRFADRFDEGDRDDERRPGPAVKFLHGPVETPLPKKVAIPTTAGTGSEATQFTIITDTENDVKMLLKGGNLIPDLAIIDPQFTMTAPKGVTSATGIDALCHAIEAYTSRLAQPLSDTFALSAVKRIFNNLTEAYEHGDNEEARIQMSLAALEAGIAFNNSSVTMA